MNSRGIEGLIVETHNWGKSVAFWRDLGWELENSLVLRHPAGGPFVYLVEQPKTQSLEVLPIVAVEDSTTFTPPASGTVRRGFEAFGFGAESIGVQTDVRWHYTDPGGRME